MMGDNPFWGGINCPEGGGNYGRGLLMGGGVCVLMRGVLMRGVISGVLIGGPAGGFALLPFLWLVNVLWFFREAFVAPPYGEQPLLRRCQWGHMGGGWGVWGVGGGIWGGRGGL